MVRKALVVIVSLACSAGCTRHAPAATAIVPAVMSGGVELAYPPDLYAKRIEGEVLLYLFVDSSGAVVHDSTRVARSSGQASFDAVALEAAPGLHFAPAHRGAVPTAAPIQIPIRFTLPDSLKHPRAPQ